jgi:hypothetical protein
MREEEEDAGQLDHQQPSASGGYWVGEIGGYIELEDSAPPRISPGQNAVSA